ncbi:MAG: hypothetical protein GF308_17785 [Candidatus Heimdallarchaeota archaeon]|nr:hypothetical protein [Candidatus Heimdallarchaeota archaeon]
MKTKTTRTKIQEGWSGPGRKDSLISSLRPQDDALHIAPRKKNHFEWWYFDALFENGYALVVFSMLVIYKWEKQLSSLFFINQMARRSIRSSITNLQR